MILVTKIELLKTLNSALDFDWNNYLAIEKNKSLVPIIENVLKISEFKEADAKIYAQLRYKLGTFYIHIKGDSKAALPHLESAKQILKDEDLL
jgi:hypothetical protein